MDNQNKSKVTPIIRIIITGALVLGALGLGATVLAPQVAQAQDEVPEEPVAREPGMRAFPGFEPRGRGGFGGNVDYDVFLAEALGISVEELQDARETADQMALEQAVEDGFITQEQADLIQAQNALRQYLDKEALMAEALGISVEELQAAREEGKAMPTLFEELGMDPATVRKALQTAYENAVGQAVSEGVITQEQADQILSGDFAGGKLFGGHPRGRDGHGDFFRMPGPPSPDSDTNQDSGL